jgi:hypothetical protein
MNTQPGRPSAPKITPAAYRSAVFYTAADDYGSDGEPLTAVAEWLDNAWQGDDDSLVEYLSDWDQDGGGDITTTPPWGTSDSVFAHGPYFVTTNAGLGYASLVEPLDANGDPLSPDACAGAQ